VQQSHSVATAKADVFRKEKKKELMWEGNLQK
jgi:hypothetical protein